MDKEKIMNRELLDTGYNICRFLGDEINFSSPDFSILNPCDENLINFLKIHNLSTIVSCIVEKHNVDFTIPSYNHSKDVFKQLKYNIFADDISKLFCDHKINHILLKGKSIQKFYPEYIVRTSSDVDFYVPECFMDQATNLMFNEGFICDGGESFQKDSFYNIELHNDMGGLNKSQKQIMLSLCDKYSDSESFFSELTDSDIYVYAVNHLYKHFVLSGVGVRMFFDIYLMKKNAQLDFEYINTMLSKLQIDGFYETVLKINDILFEGKKASCELEEVVSFIFDSGMYGKLSTFDHLTIVTRQMSGVSSVEQTLVNYGLGFKYMKNRYPILYKFPVLYPFSFIHRFVNGMFNRRDVLNRVIKRRKNVAPDKIDEYKRIFEIAKIK